MATTFDIKAKALELAVRMGRQPDEVVATAKIFETYLAEGEGAVGAAKASTNPKPAEAATVAKAPARKASRKADTAKAPAD